MSALACKFFRLDNRFYLLTPEDRAYTTSVRNGNDRWWSVGGIPAGADYLGTWLMPLSVLRYWAN